MIDRVFELFGQVDATPSRSQGELGIGLTLVRRLIEMHNGTVTARSAGPGHGSAFFVRLPTSASTRDSASGTDRGADAGDVRWNEQRVLIVDDNVDAAERISMILEASGFSVHGYLPTLTTRQASKSSLRAPTTSRLTRCKRYKRSLREQIRFPVVSAA